jgi:hypothetical protein
LAGALSVQSASAAVITFGGWQAEWSDSLNQSDGSSVALTLLSSSDGQWIALQKVAVFADPAGRDGLDSIDINFTQISPNAVPKIVIAQENVTNASGTFWTGFNFSISGGVAGSAGLPHFDMDESFYNPSPFNVSPFELTGTTSDSGVVRGIELGNGLLADGGIWWPGIPKGALVIMASPNLTGPKQSFTFIEQPRIEDTPPVPEPASAAMILAGGFLLLSSRRRNESA